MVAAIWLFVVAQSAPPTTVDGFSLKGQHKAARHAKSNDDLEIFNPFEGGRPPLPADLPYYYGRLLKPADLEGKTLRELNLIRNTLYARAGNVFRKRWLHDYFAGQDWYRATGMDDGRLSDVDRKNAEIVTDYELAIPAETLRARLAALEGATAADAGSLAPPKPPVMARLASNAPDDIERGLLRQELGLADPASRSPLENPAALDNLLYVRDLKDLSPRELRLVRNMIYARRGQVFTSKDLGNYFRRTEWYHPDQAFSASRLTAIDQKNVRIVQSVEDTAREEGFGGRVSGERFMLMG